MATTTTTEVEVAALTLATIKKSEHITKPNKKKKKNGSATKSKDRKEPVHNKMKIEKKKERKGTD